MRSGFVPAMCTYHLKSHHASCYAGVDARRVIRGTKRAEGETQAAVPASPVPAMVTHLLANQVWCSAETKERSELLDQ